MRTRTGKVQMRSRCEQKLLMRCRHKFSVREISSAHHKQNVITPTLRARTVTRAGAVGRIPLGKFFSPLEKCVGRSLKFWAPLRKLFAPRSVPKWLRACSAHRRSRSRKLKRRRCRRMSYPRSKSP